MPRFVIPGGAPGLLVRGNIDIDARAKLAIPNKLGGKSSVFSSTYKFNSQDDTGAINVPTKIRAHHQTFAILVPGVVFMNGKWGILYSKYGPLNYAKKSGLHLGVFDNEKHANSYGTRLHNEQAAAAPKGTRVLYKKGGRTYNCRQTIRSGNAFLDDCHPVR